MLPPNHTGIPLSLHPYLPDFTPSFCLGNRKEYKKEKREKECV
jgi:hypothetical protein